jgi:hypothetical protein
VAQGDGLRQFIQCSTLGCDGDFFHGTSDVTFTAILSLLPMLLALNVGGGLQVQRIVVEDQIIMRVPVRPRPPQVQWVEHKGPKCVSASEIRGAFLSGNDHVDFIIDGRQLLRAHLDESCPALDFYAGFYLSSTDERVCARRDVIRSRMGSTCQIDQFRKLVPKVKR